MHLTISSKFLSNVTNWSKHTAEDGVEHIKMQWKWLQVEMKKEEIIIKIVLDMTCWF